MTWEPAAHLNCPALLKKFHAQERSALHPTTIKRAISKTIKRPINKGKPSIPKTTSSASMPTIWLAPSAADILKIPILLNTPINTPHRDEWSCLLATAEYCTSVYNDTDAEGPPDGFQWLEGYQYSAMPPPSSEALAGCSCVGNCMMSGEYACQCILECVESQAPYDASGHMQHRPEQGVVYECNPNCSCAKNCGMKVAQHGRKVALQIFRCGGQKGWGVRALENIPQGTFVSKYAGEMMPSKLADWQAQTCDGAFLFSLDYFGESSTSGMSYVIDAKKFGNIARFFNHSCDPNMACYAMFLTTQTAEIHDLAFFTTRDVTAGEELTFSYFGNAAVGSKGKVSKAAGTVCLCGSAKCQKFVLMGGMA
ncbi:uncharacterized protein EV422DRAFT_306142 [Fimicolochytrium jonesii]|uniref:uncharacterized protein n=1 Tax=Fimicolochytrium jonesii TaxID=1396493 RepID=UPI0022FDFC72|nr:uncharacterized protein EV422DRAFT_306142 [Fimicolochytrium jonesii]KAI8824087.1 hypothetical protein EV422DRAFT_306142 [Fimicolochytrium jonesii]